MTCVQPIIRALQSVREQAGIYKVVNATGFTLFKNDQNANRRPATPVVENIFYLGTKYTNPS